MFHLCVCMCTMCMPSAQGGQKCIRTPETGVTDTCKYHVVVGTESWSS